MRAVRLPWSKSIYLRLPFPSRSGGLERAFIETADRDGSVDAFCKLNEQKHSFTRLRYVKEDGLPAFYHPDFLVRCEGPHLSCRDQGPRPGTTPNVKRKKRAAVSWCDRINTVYRPTTWGCRLALRSVGRGGLLRLAGKGCVDTRHAGIRQAAAD